MVVSVLTDVRPERTRTPHLHALIICYHNNSHMSRALQRSAIHHTVHLYACTNHLFHSCVGRARRRFCFPPPHPYTQHIFCAALFNAIKLGFQGAGLSFSSWLACLSHTTLLLYPSHSPRAMHTCLAPSLAGPSLSIFLTLRALHTCLAPSLAGPSLSVSF